MCCSGDFGRNICLRHFLNGNAGCRDAVESGLRDSAATSDTVTSEPLDTPNTERVVQLRWVCGTQPDDIC